MGQSWPKALVEALSAVVLVCSGGESAASSASSSSNTALSSEFFSTRIQKMIESRGKGKTAVDAKIESSKVHWSELREVGSDQQSGVEDVEIDKQHCTEADKVFFRESLLKKPDGSIGSFFEEWSDLETEMGEKIAEGAQGELFMIHDVEDKHSNLGLVMKVFKAEAGSLEALYKLWPPGMLEAQSHETGMFVIDNSPPPNMSGVSPVVSGVMLEDGRFGFVMFRFWGDLRTLIDARMIHNGNQASPFRDGKELLIMYEIARGMRALHKKDIIHRDLKASNVLILPQTWDYSEGIMPDIDSSEDFKFYAIVADFECSLGTVGTEFWRAPEILIALKNRRFEPKVCTEKSDVYSFGMTSYEILSGKIPFEGVLSNNYDIVLGGGRPKLPSGTHPWIRSMLDRCWHHEPSMRPSFEELVEEFETSGNALIANFMETCRRDSDKD